MTINVFQFWNTEKAPEDVEDLMATWKADSAFLYRRYCVETADAYISNHFDQRITSAFRQCAVPAMMADFFRYCALYQEGGIYVDADTNNEGGLAEFVRSSQRGILMKREERVANDFLFVRQAKDALYERVIQQMVENIENRISNNVWMVTGPGIMTHMYHDATRRECFNGFDFYPARIIRNIVQFRNDLTYKTSEDDWRSKLNEKNGSIFK